MPGCLRTLGLPARYVSDVAPMRGVILGGGEQELEVHVTVTQTAARGAQASSQWVAAQ